MLASSHTLMFMSRIEADRLPIQECTSHSTRGPVKAVSEPSKAPAV